MVVVMRPVFLTAVALALAAPAAAQTTADERARCEELYARYERYSNTGGESRSGSAVSALEARQAVEDCRRGNTSQGMAILERKLRALGFKI